MTKKTIIVLCPGGVATGGVELLHQLVDSINLNGGSAFILYYPFKNNLGKLSAYKNYNTPLVRYCEISELDTIIIIPEVFTYLIYKFKKCKIYLWWLSVDNYIKSAKIRFALANKFLPWKYVNISKSKDLDLIDLHLYQSEYARSYLELNGIKNVYELSDYINSNYLIDINKIDYSLKRNIVVYNPAKGIKSTKKIMSALDKSLFVPILNMSRDEVKDLLKKAKIYIDFGNHPGKDRIPREAAAMGCCVITNKRGSAKNSIDVNISERFKFDDLEIGFEFKVASAIEKIFISFEDEHHHFNKYRAIIENEKNAFNSAVIKLIKKTNF